MDREIPMTERRRRRRKRWMIAGGGALLFFLSIGWATLFLKPSVRRTALRMSVVERGTIAFSAGASGTVAPACEEMVNSPLESRILEVYKKAGDSVEAGQPILKLDLQSARTEWNKLLDEEQMRLHKQRQLKLNNYTKLKDLAMQVRVSAMKLSRMEVSDEPVRVRLDPVLFQQVLINIVKNAVESIGEEGTLYIRTAALPPLLEIADTGRGIPKEVETKLFTPFFSTKPNGQGIGLMLIREVLAKHRCTFSLRTGEDGLTRFRILFC